MYSRSARLQTIVINATIAGRLYELNPDSSQSNKMVNWLLFGAKSFSGDWCFFAFSQQRLRL